jgi:hypothetical protein
MPSPNTNLHPNPEALSLRDLASMLVKHYGIREGLWEVAFEMQVLIGKLGPSAEKSLPGAMMGISRVGLTRAASPSEQTVDAGQVNPVT